MSSWTLRALLLISLAPAPALAGTLTLHPSAPHESRTDAPATPPPERATPLIGGRSEAGWRDTALAQQRALESAEAELASCEAREAPAPYRDVAGYVARGRRGPYWVEVKNCDDARIEVRDAQREIRDFEDQARRLGVPPGWLR